MVTKITVQDLFDNSCHYGQKASRWHPKMKSFIYCKKKGIHIFDLTQTAKKLAELLNRIETIVNEGNDILFVSTKPHTRDILSQIQKDTGMPVVSYKWLGGLLTNFSTIKERILYMKRLREDFKTKDIERYTKKEQAKFEKELDKLEKSLGGVAEMKKIPKAIFIVDGFKDKIAIKEAKQVNLEILGIADSNVDPSFYDYFVPANDDAIQSLEFILGHIVTTIVKNKK